MMRRPKGQARRLQSIRRHRSRRRSGTDLSLGTDPGWVSAAVFYTDPLTSGATAVWLEPDTHGERLHAPFHF